MFLIHQAEFIFDFSAILEQISASNIVLSLNWLIIN